MRKSDVTPVAAIPSCPRRRKGHVCGRRHRASHVRARGWRLSHSDFTHLTHFFFYFFFLRGCRNNAWGNGHCGLRSSPPPAPSDRQVHLTPSQLGLSFGRFNTRVGAAIAVAIRCHHGAFFFRALELLAHGKTDTVTGARNSGFLHGTWSKGTVTTPQLAKLVGERVGRRG